MPSLVPNVDCECKMGGGLLADFWNLRYNARVRIRASLEEADAAVVTAKLLTPKTAAIVN